jgi:hypothetical protein
LFVALTFKSNATGAADALDWEVAFNASLRRRISTAAWLALKDVGDEIKSKGERAIAGAGFGKKWQGGYQVRTYPDKKPSIDAAIFAYHKIPYAGIFETGGTIKGKPFMWLPTKYAPVGLGNRLRKMTPARFIKYVGPLRSARRRGNKAPLLIGKLGGKSVPLFVGISLTRQRKRFNLGAVVTSAAGRFPLYYESQLKKTDELRINF